MLTAVPTAAGCGERDKGLPLHFSPAQAASTRNRVMAAEEKVKCANEFQRAVLDDFL